MSVLDSDALPLLAHADGKLASYIVQEKIFLNVAIDLDGSSFYLAGGIGNAAGQADQSE